MGMADYVTLSVYLLGMLAMGLYFARRNTSTEQYFVGGRKIPGIVIGLSLIGTSISSMTFLSMPGDAFKGSWINFLYNLGLIPAVVIAGACFLPFYRQGHVTSAYEYLGSRFGQPIRVYGAIAFIVAQLIRVSIILYLISIPIGEITHLDPVKCIVLGGILVSIYTIIGGIEAVVWTDVIQTIVLLLGGIVCVVLVAMKLDNGLSDVWQVGLADHKLSIHELMQDGSLRPVSWGWSLTHKTAPLLLLFGLTHFMTEYTANQNVIQRYCASKSLAEAKKAMYFCMVSSIVIWALFMLVGTSLYVYYQEHPHPEATAMLQGQKPESGILPLFILSHMPPGLAGFVMAAAIAAAMSSLDSSINAISAVVVVDLLRPNRKRHVSDTADLRIAQVVAVASSVVMIGGAVILSGMQSNTLQTTANALASLCGAGLLGMYLIGFLTRKGDTRSIGAGIACTLVFSLWMVLNDKAPQVLPSVLQIKIDSYYATLIGNAIMFMVGFSLACLIPRKQPLAAHQTIWDVDYDQVT
ncbi:MAG: sodium:solute symporter [Planctomycetales bacterium]|nr:sodium:solute symporter [Planctomycetales bacterium]